MTVLFTTVRVRVILPLLIAVFSFGIETPAEGATERATVVVEVAGESKSTVLEGTMTVRVAGGEFDYPVEVSAPGETVVSLSLPELAHGHTEGVSVRVEVEGYWSPVVGIATLGEGRTRIHLDPSGHLIGQVERAGDDPSPETVSVQLRALVDSEEASPGRRERGSDLVEVACPLADSGRMNCEVPAGHFDLSLRVPGMTPRYVHEVAVPAGGQLDLKDWRLLPGASIAGWIALDGGKGLLEDSDHPVSVTLTPQLERGQTIIRAGAKEPELTLRTIEAKADSRGFFQLTGVGTGRYVLTASRDGYVPASVGPVELVGRAETQLDKPLRLSPPVGVEMVLDPPLAPNQEPWRILLRREPGTAQEELIDEWADLGGVWRTTRLPAGQYRLVLTDIDDARWMTSSLKIGETTGPILIEVPLVEIVGEIVGDDEDVAAELWFGGRNGEESIHLISDADGYFQGVLPRTGTWILEGSVDGGNTLYRLDDIEIEQSKDNTPISLRIELPGGEVTGTVVDTSGDVVAGAVLVVINPERRSREALATTDGDGTFAFRGLRSGTLFVRANFGRASSSWQTLEVEPGATSEALELVIQPPLVFEGTVISPVGPVPGAQVILNPQEDWASMKPAVLKRAITESDGTFSFDLPADTQHADLVVLPPGFGADIRYVNPKAQVGSPLVVNVGLESGDIFLQGDASPEKTLIVHNGAFARWTWFRKWAEDRSGGASTTEYGASLPKMAPGRYAVCPMTEEAVSERSGTADGCSSGSLPAQGQLVLTLTAPSSVK